MPKVGNRDKYQVNLAQRDVIFFQARAAERAANEEKSARLRALRLAKEAEDKIAAQLAAAQPKRKTRNK
jgi:hypothetical protein